MRYPYGEWAPDLFELVGGGKALRVAKNVLPKLGGYEPYPQLSNLTTQALPFAPKGAFRGQRSDGTNAFFAGLQDTTNNNFEIYQFKDSGGSNSWVDVSGSSVSYGSIRAHRCEFAQMDASVFCASFTTDTVALDLGRDTAFDEIAPNCPRAYHIASANGFMVTADCFFRDIGRHPDGIAWSAFGAPRSWPDPDSDQATALLSGRNILRNGGGPVNALIAGTEVMLALQENAIVRMDFIGNDAVWAFRDIVTDHGLRVKGAAIAFPRGVFYLGSDGFRVCNYRDSTPVGKGRIDEWFDANFDADYPDSFSIARDPKRTQIRMSFAAPGASGVPNRTLIYDWELDRFSYATETAYSLIGAGSSPASLDSPDIPNDRDTLEDDLSGSGDLNYGILSFDDRQSGTFANTMGGFDSTFRLGTYAGVNLEGLLETGALELNPGRRAVTSGIRSHVRGPDVTVSGAAMGDEEVPDPDDLTFTAPMPRVKNGVHPIEMDTRYLVARFHLGSAWSEAAFFDVEWTPGGEI